ncbi:MAG TPA: VWA domain-containing protein [Blastocatellia bacterium]|nr:VWA domain-containing protein [Blastocatellia bacterium]
MSDERKGLTGSLFKGLTRNTVESLAMKMGLKPNERGWLTLDIGASLVGASPKVAMDFFKAVKEVSEILDNGDLRAWAEMGRKIAAKSPEEASDFFRFSNEVLLALPEGIRPLLIALCSKQVILSEAAALTTFRNAPRMVGSLGEERSASRLFKIAVEVAHRSVKHSTEVLTAAPQALVALRRFDSGAVESPAAEPLARRPEESPMDAVLDLAESFAQRTGATAAEFLSAVGEGLEFVQHPSDVIELCRQTGAFLERGGATALQYFRSARSVIEVGGALSFEKWNRVTRKVADEGNAIVYDFLKLTPKVLATLRVTQRKRAREGVNTVLNVVEELAGRNVYVALECFKSSPRALAVASLDQFQVWAREGAALYREDRRKAQAYYALESKTSQESLRGAHDGVALESVSHLLRLYVEGLTGREMMIAPLGSIPEESKICDGHTIQLPAVVAEFGSPEEDFKLYKALAAHASGQVEFGTRAMGAPEIRAALQEIDSHYAEQERRLLAEDLSNPEYVQHSDVEHLGLWARPELEPIQIETADYKTVLSRFPNRTLAARIFTTLENGRIDWRLRAMYRGIRRDLDFVRSRLVELRPKIIDLTVEQAIYEMLFQITLCGGVIDETARRAYPEIIFQFERVVADYLRRDDATVADTLIATFRVYELLNQRQSQQDSESETEQQEQESEKDQQDNQQGENDQQQQPAEQQRRPELFNQWSQQVEETLPTDSDLFNELMNAESSEQELQEGDEVFFYDEWDRELGDHRAKWCRVIQRENRRGHRDFVEQVRARYSGVISSIRHQFQMLKPESLRKIKGELDGEDFDLQAVIDHHVDKKTTGRPSDRLYIRRVRRERDVAVSFLLDMSSSTARTITRHPNQPYTRPGQKIIDIEKQGLVLMSEALEAVGDAYSISGFTSEGRRNVKYFSIKKFGEKYSPEVEKRIGGITYHNNTRLGAAIRHAASELERQDARTKLLIVLSDGRPYDHDYGDSRYAREDTKMALRQTKIAGVTPFCITIDRESEAELKDLYGEVGYTIIDDVMSLPERLPGIYRRLTT